ncbi:hypothetical protein CC78DRAFT_543061 [Lojkania enalia]|uniref:Uncharacterized protein n=1 Tax=Lojkania enalia TaxID=147567 RepID=A0A9P4KDS4_9PLEO|nr:hypothetical protein CC78DRAFT_543061 [Didymosphaeria enalia]
MAWSGPAAGTPQYQPPTYAIGQPGYAQQPYQYGQQAGYGQYQGPPSYPPSGPPQRPPDARPPKKKGNPIITRYPPPPGYRGPAHPQGSYGTHQHQNQYQQPTQPYQPGYTAPPNYSNPAYPAPNSFPPTPAYSPQSYGPPQNYPQQPNYAQQGYPAAQGYQQPPQGYPPSQEYSQAPSYQVGLGYAPQPSTYQGYPSQPAPIDPNQPPYSQTQSWQQPPGASPYPPTPSEQYNPYGPPPHTPSLPSQDTNATPTPTSAQPVANQNTPTTTQPSTAIDESNDKPQLFLAWDDWDFDFDGAIWPKSNEPIDPNLSLGVIIWRPAKQVTRALPSTFDEAEEQALKPPAEKLGNGESVSNYFTLENSHEAFLNVRQTDEWRKIKNDPIFVIFPDAKDMDLIPIEECIANRDRPDEPYEEVQEDEDEGMEDSTWNVMDNLEQALSGQVADRVSSTLAKEAGPSRSQIQEDILASLGVTGSPKPPSNEPAPIPFPISEEKATHSLPEKPSVPPHFQIPPRPEQPPAPQRAHSYGGHRNSAYVPPPQRPYGSVSSTPTRPPPPPPPERAPWNSVQFQKQSNGSASNASRASPARSDSSNRTLAGSDFEEEKSTIGAEKPPETTPKLHHSDNSFSRKRSYDEADQDDEKLRQQDDHARRKRRQPQVAAAYGLDIHHYIWNNR